MTTVQRPANTTAFRRAVEVSRTTADNGTWQGKQTEEYKTKKNDDDVFNNVEILVGGGHCIAIIHGCN